MHDAQFAHLLLHLRTEAEERMAKQFGHLQRQRLEIKSKVLTSLLLLSEAAQVDAWYRFLSANNVTMRSVPNTHRDGARSFYCVDPAGNQVQLIYHPPVSEFEQRRR